MSYKCVRLCPTFKCLQRCSFHRFRRPFSRRLPFSKPKKLLEVIVEKKDTAQQHRISRAQTVPKSPQTSTTNRGKQKLRTENGNVTTSQINWQGSWSHMISQGRRGKQHHNSNRTRRIRRVLAAGKSATISSCAVWRPNGIKLSAWPGLKGNDLHVALGVVSSSNGDSARSLNMQTAVAVCSPNLKESAAT